MVAAPAPHLLHLSAAAALKWDELCLEKSTALSAWGPALNGTALLGLQSNFGDKPYKFQVICPQNETAVLKGLDGALTALKIFGIKTGRIYENIEMVFIPK